MTDYAPQPPINPEEDTSASMLIKILGGATLAASAAVIAYSQYRKHRGISETEEGPQDD